MLSSAVLSDIEEKAEAEAVEAALSVRMCCRTDDLKASIVGETMRSVTGDQAVTPVVNGPADQIL